MTQEERVLIFCADTHGWENFDWLVKKLTESLKLEHADCIILGDFGAGFRDNKGLEFEKALDKVYDKYKDCLEKRDIVIYTIRGNHDDPKYFKDDKEFSKPNLIFMEDYKIYNIAGRTIFPIGGSVSMDRKCFSNNGTPVDYRTEGKNWWSGEEIVETNKKTWPLRVDIIISHDAPSIFDPIYIKKDVSKLSDAEADYENDIWDRCQKGRMYLSEIAKYVNADYWYFGHHHCTYTGEYKNIKYRGLGIDKRMIPEIIEAGPKQDHEIQGEENKKESE